MIKMNLYRWFIMCMIGVLTAMIAVSIDISIEKLADWKYSLIKLCIFSSYLPCLKLFNLLLVPFFAWKASTYAEPTCIPLDMQNQLNLLKLTEIWSVKDMKFAVALGWFKRVEP